MGIKFICEHCGKTLDVEEYLAGQSIECYHCRQPVVIPDEGEIAIIEFQCLGCGTDFRVPASRAGRRSKCPECGAALVVPDAGGAAPGFPEPHAPPPAAEPYEPAYPDELPEAPPRTPMVRGRAPTAARPQPAYAQQQQEGGEEELVAPPKKGVGAGWIIFWVALALFLIIAVWLVSSKDGAPRGKAGGPRTTRSARSSGRYVQIFAVVKYNGIHNVFMITNGTPDVWRDVTFTIETTSGEYACSRGTLPPNQVLTLKGEEFVGAGGTFDGRKMSGTHFIITARLPSGRMGRFILNWLGRAPSGRP